MKIFDFFKKKKNPEITFKIFDTETESIKETRVFKDGIYSHSVNVLVWSKEIIEELQEIQKKSHG